MCVHLLRFHIFPEILVLYSLTIKIKMDACFRGKNIILKRKLIFIQAHTFYMSIHGQKRGTLTCSCKAIPSTHADIKRETPCIDMRKEREEKRERNSSICPFDRSNLQQHCFALSFFFSLSFSLCLNGHTKRFSPSALCF